MCYEQGSLVAKRVKNPPAMQGMQVRSLDQEDPLEKEMAVHSRILARNSHGQRNLVGYSPCGVKESDTAERLTNNKVLRTLRKTVHVSI